MKFDRIPLYPDIAPVADPAAPDQAAPALTPFFCDGEKNTCVIVCPGGGYVGRCENHEGVEICEWLNSIGVSAILLSYRLDREPVPQNDLSEAIRYVRFHAEVWHIDPHKIGVMGFSAGGHLCASVLTHPERFERPDFGILCYAVISFTDELTHEGTRTTLLGEENVTPENIRYYSAEMNVTKDTPPCFVFHTKKDSCVPCENSTRFADAMEKAGARCTLALYENGEHGVGLAQTVAETCMWPERLKKFLKKI